jgi:ribosome biogenesis GTPase
MTIFPETEKLGFDGWFKEKTDPSLFPDCRTARVISVNKNSYAVSDGRNEMFAEVSGKFLYKADSSLDYPTAGDWVFTEIFNDDSFAVIHEIIPRKTLLKRKTPGKKIEYQLIAANIDTAMIMQSADADYNLRRLERYLVMISESNIQPVVLLSKSDLAEPDELEKMKAGISEVMPGAEISSFSNNNEEDLEKIKRLLAPGKTYCLIGSSGVGKTTLINNLLKEEKFKTQEIRIKDGRGKHTTSRRELIFLDNGAMIIDTPGMRELGLISAETGLDDTFQEIAALSAQCRFNDCSHTTEEGCAVRDALEKGVLTEERLRNYRKMQKEALYNELSYIEKRRKDKQFGKYIRSILKNKKDKR